ncbi:MAG: uracil-DNA glycosylase [Desulfobulbaceae bacterium]|nr:uracil-DNA glycosylase [Desulfobulbaceae bacterium]
MTPVSVDSPGRFLLDLKKVLRLQRDFGIEAYPRSPEVERFLNSSPSMASTKSGASAFIQEERPLPVEGKASHPHARARLTLADIEAEFVDCHHCLLPEQRSPVVFGVGNPKAALFIVGDCPRVDDQETGTPFSGSAGELLGKMLNAIGLQRSDVYLTTVVKCRAAGSALSVSDPEAWNPSEAQIKGCLPFLFRQIDAVAPKVICAMGQVAAQAVLRSKTPLVRLRGSFHDCHGVPLMPTFDPAFLLKNQEMKKATWIDLQLIQAKLLDS